MKHEPEIHVKRLLDFARSRRVTYSIYFSETPQQKGRTNDDYHEKIRPATDEGRKGVDRGNDKPPGRMVRDPNQA